MEKNVKYNDFKKWPKKMLEDLRIRDEDMPKGEQVVEFQILRNPITISNIKGDKTKRWPACVSLTNKDVLYDEQGNEYPIAHIESYNPDGSPNFGLVEFEGRESGAIMITGKNPNKFGLLKYLRCMNANQTNPFRSTNKSPVFKELERVKTAKEKVKADKEIAQVKLTIHDLSNAEAITILKSLKQPVYQEEDRNISALLTYVSKEDNMKRFMKMSKDVRMPIISLVNEAKNKNIIAFDENETVWKYSKTNLAMCPSVAPGYDPVEFLVEYMHNDSEGEKVLEYIKEEMEKTGEGVLQES